MACRKCGSAEGGQINQRSRLSRVTVALSISSSPWLQLITAAFNCTVTLQPLHSPAIGSRVRRLLWSQERVASWDRCCRPRLRGVQVCFTTAEVCGQPQQARSEPRLQRVYVSRARRQPHRCKRHPRVTCVNKLHDIRTCERWSRDPPRSHLESYLTVLRTGRPSPRLL